jgi:hypothetical protein
MSWEVVRRVTGSESVMKRGGSKNEKGGGKMIRGFEKGGGEIP